MTHSSKIQQEWEDLVGDGRWWERRPFVFDDANLIAVVPDVQRAIEELKFLYDAATCVRLVRTPSARLVVPLFIGAGFISQFDEYLQLGEDLAQCRGWRARPKLVGDLRGAKSYEGARFEVGVWAGLVRVGLSPEVEPTDLKSQKRPDFVVTVGGLCVAIELKGLADPDRERNTNALQSALLSELVHIFHGVWNHDLTLVLTEAAQGFLDEQVERFESDLLPNLVAEFRAHASRFNPNSSVTMPLLGTLVLAHPPWNASGDYGGTLVLQPDDDLDDDALMKRALLKVKRAGQQLGAVEADVRIAVIWGSKHMLPARWAAEQAAAAFSNHDEWRIPVDWAVFYNAHTLGASPGWTIEIEPVQLAHARREIPAEILSALRRWGRRRRAQAPA